MRIDQIFPSMQYGSDIKDAVLVLQKLIKGLRYESDVFTESVKLEQKENIIYHRSMGSRAAKTLADIKANKKVLFYHGIMPLEYFKNHPLQANLLSQRKELSILKNQFELAITTTKHFEQELHQAGYERTVVLPPPIDLEEYNQEPDGQVMEAYKGDYTNIVFVGQITPNKKLEDTIAVFNYYHKKINPRSRLFLVGSFSAHPRYCQKLLALTKELEIKDVFLTGRVSFKQLLAYYRLSQVFLCMSEYDSYFNPLIEAMYLKVPVVAFDWAAMPEVLEGAGCLINDRDIRETARLVDRMVNDRALREDIITRQSERVTDFLPEKIFPLYNQLIMDIFENEEESNNGNI